MLKKTDRMRRIGEESTCVVLVGPPSIRDNDRMSSIGQPRSRGKGPISSRDSLSAAQEAAGVCTPPGASTDIPIDDWSRRCRCAVIDESGSQTTAPDVADVIEEKEVATVQHRHSTSSLCSRHPSRSAIETIGPGRRR